MEVAGGDVVVRLQHFTPRFEADGFRIVYGRLEDLLVVLVSGDPAQVETDGFEVVCDGAARVDEPDETFGGIKDAVGVVVRERPVVRPRVASILELGRERLTDTAESVRDTGTSAASRAS